MARGFGDNGLFIGLNIDSQKGIGIGRCPCCGAKQKIKVNTSHHLYFFCSAYSGCGLKLQGQAFDSDVHISGLVTTTGTTGWFKGNKSKIAKIIDAGPAPEIDLDQDEKKPEPPVPVVADQDPAQLEPAAPESPPKPKPKPKKEPAPGPDQDKGGILDGGLF